MNQVRWTSKVLWASIVAQVVALLLALKIIDIGLGEQINVVAILVLELLNTLGIVNNPTNPTAL